MIVKSHMYTCPAYTYVENQHHACVLSRIKLLVSLLIANFNRDLCYISIVIPVSHVLYTLDDISTSSIMVVIIFIATTF